MQFFGYFKNTKKKYPCIFSTCIIYPKTFGFIQSKFSAQFFYVFYLLLKRLTIEAQDTLPRLMGSKLCRKVLPIDRTPPAPSQGEP